MRRCLVRKIVLLSCVAAPCFCLSGCVSTGQPNGTFSEAQPVDRPEELFFARLGSYVLVKFRNGETASGYLVERDSVTFTLRGIGWQAAKLSTYENSEVADFQVKDRPPGSEDLRY